MQRFHAEGSSTASRSNDYHVLPPSEKQIRFAQQIEKGSNIASGRPKRPPTYF